MATTKFQQVTEVVEEVYQSNQQQFVADTMAYVDARFKSGMAQYEAGESMDFDTFKEKFYSIEF